MGGPTDREDINQMLSEAQRSEEASGSSNSTASTHRIRQWLKQHKRLTILSICALLVLLVVIPFTRYSIGGLFITRDAVVTILDDQTNQPVSNATVVIRGNTFQTSAEGTVELKHAKPGNPEAQVSKQYYESASSRIKIDLLNRTYTQTIRLKPTGRAMSLKVTNRFTGAGLANVTIDAGGVQATTDQTGSASLVLSPSISTVEAQLSVDDYNTARTTLSVPGDLTTNTIPLTPSGKVYVVSKQSGKLDVVKLNLDGSGREVAVKATGNEEVSNTQIWASADWRFVVLRARREGPKAGLYLLDISSDTLTDLDTAPVDFQIVGWYKDKFIYTAYDPTKPEWQPKRDQLKLFNADDGKLTTIETTQASGSGYDDYMAQVFTNIALTPDTLVYGIQWVGANPDIHKRPAVLREVSLPSLTKRDLRSDINASISLAQQEPDKLNIQIAASSTTFYQYTNKSLSTIQLTAEEMFRPWPQYFPSSNGKYAWDEPLDGKRRVFVANATLGEKLAPLASTELRVNGWFGADYLLLSKSDSELYIMPAQAEDVLPQKITDYHRPPSGAIY